MGRGSILYAPRMALVAFEDLLACLSFEHNADDRYRLPNLKMDYHRVFGGQLIAQSIAIAAHSAAGKRVKSIHTLLPKEGELAREVEFAVSREQDGRSFAARTITGRQGDRVIHRSMVSLHGDEPGPEHAIPMPEVGAPEEATPVELDMIPWETRVIDGVDLAERAAASPRYAFWMRTPALDDDPAWHQALFAHATMLTLIGTALRPHAGLSEADAASGRLATAVTSHTLWFHRPLRVDDWLLLSQESPSASGARAFGSGHAFTRAGELVASYAQEALVRPLAP